ncbi:MAG TPA: hypothetical protein PKC85_07830 [Bacteroidia bacterium]|jgi:hypothetical protein|nr:hypothetical protein [Bacteroidia bacterium]
MTQQIPKIDDERIREKVIDKILFVFEITLVIAIIALCCVIITSL